ncbi:MAG: ABC transporter permease [Clostridiales Family XIII bacterium]|nr:ABC transporter permease [Clostridiales Family XIII bacterium]
MAIAVGLFVGFLILLFSNPAQAPAGFGAVLTGGFSDMKNLGQTLYFAVPIILTGLSVAFSMKTGLFNIGASGQFVVGAYAAILVGVKCTFLPGHTHWIVALLAALAAGALWGAVPGLLKAYRNVNEVITCIMMNYVGMHLVNYLIVRTVFDPLKNQTMRVAASANLPKMGFDAIFRVGNNVSGANSGVLVALLMAVVLWVILQKTKLGYELKACGLNEKAARYAGIDAHSGIVISMMISGAMAGLGGALLYLSGSGNGISVADVLAKEGFNGIPVALLGLNHPIGVVAAGLFVSCLTVGGFNMQLYEFAPEVIEIMIAVIIYFSAFALLLQGFLRSRGHRFRAKAASGAFLDAEEAKRE